MRQYAALFVCLLSALAQAQQPIDWVNELIGTGSGPVGYGGTMPFVAAPFGMTDWTAQTRQNKLGTTSYKYEDNSITGFIGTHQPAIWMGDYGYVTLMPEIGSLKVTPEDRKMTFSHQDEVVRPDFYSVSLDAGASRHVTAEMSATERCALMRFTFPAGVAGSVLVEASRPRTAGFVQIDSVRHEIAGYNPDRMDSGLGPHKLSNFKGYFVVQFRQSWKSAVTYGSGEDASHGYTGALAAFSPGAIVEARVGTSFLSIDDARRNLAAELPDWDIAVVRQALAEKWNARLGLLQVQGATLAQRHILYTALYHALLYPRVFDEPGPDGHEHYYSAFDDTVHPGHSYTAYSIWDTFRAEFSLLTMVEPERIDGMVSALLQDYKEGGWMPKWPNPSYTNIMIGTHADSLIAEAIQKGFHGFDRQTAWDAVYKDAMTPPEGDTTRRWYDREPHTPYEARGGLTYSKLLGYVPNDRTAESASRTLEDAYDDWCVAQVARSLGRMDDYRFFLQRSQNYRHVFNPATGFMQAKNSDGGWAKESEGWTEGDKWVYTYAVMHDEAGLMRLMGGEAKYNALLDAHFAGGHNQHKNEPSHHYGYLYDYSGEPWKTQAKVREIAAKEYADAPSGIDGDDDCGQMSAWYLFTALGFYPVNPASGEYMIGSPMFTRMSLSVGGGKRFTVKAQRNSATNVYIQSAKLNGKPLHQPLVRYDEIMRGGTLEFVMGPKPSSWAAAWRANPVLPQ
jgi:predicted alpha-1,2-mannosidase